MRSLDSVSVHRNRPRSSSPRRDEPGDLGAMPAGRAYFRLGVARPHRGTHPEFFNRECRQSQHTSKGASRICRWYRCIGPAQRSGGDESSLEEARSEAHGSLARTHLRDWPTGREDQPSSVHSEHQRKGNSCGRAGAAPEGRRHRLAPASSRKWTLSSYLDSQERPPAVGGGPSLPGAGEPVLDDGAESRH